MIIERSTWLIALATAVLGFALGQWPKGEGQKAASSCAARRSTRNSCSSTSARGTDLTDQSEGIRRRVTKKRRREHGLFEHLHGALLDASLKEEFAPTSDDT